MKIDCLKPNYGEETYEGKVFKVQSQLEKIDKEKH